MTQNILNISRSNLALDLATPQEKAPVSAKKFDSNQVPLTDISLDWVHVPRPVDRTIAALDLTEINAPDRKKLESMKLIKRSTELDQKAKENGVDLAKKNFFKALFNVALGGVGLGLSIAATVLTGGAGLPVMAASGVAFALVVADAGCAFADWRNKAGGGDGLKMGSDALANVVHTLLDKMGMNDERAQYWANTASVALRTTLIVSTLWCSTTSSASVPGAIGSALSMIKLSKSAVGTIGGLGLDVSIDNAKNNEAKFKKAATNADLFESQIDQDIALNSAQHKASQLETKLSQLESRSQINQLARAQTITKLQQTNNELQLLKAQIMKLVISGELSYEVQQSLGLSGQQVTV
ncbi:hypothetical protein [Shewanella surugensis]|uniref:Uncharacterized protein n=1 Tax=Shewanella surugensis TaxID=212020 RepID=A0ABT0L6B7_9GAMM|nr:hypothetical protein [Shewanella surugensis]MCL1123228.1 hypothetical protein [Shewanella surugensis]